MGKTTVRWALMLTVVAMATAAQAQWRSVGTDEPFPHVERNAAQERTVDRFKVFYDFQFADRVVESGIGFQHQVVDDAGRDYKPVHYDHGNGVVVSDVDGDGLLDIYFVTQVGSNELWKNLGGGRFENITEEAGVGVSDRVGVTASFADIDNDGDPDLFVSTVRMGNLLFENDGGGKFSDITKAAGLDYTGHSSSGVFFDYDRDGLLDLFLTNVGVYTQNIRGQGGYWIGFKDAFAGHLKPQRTERSILYRNMGDNRFSDVTEAAQLVDESWTGDASPIDFNRDGYPDLYVLNMQGHDAYYENVEGKYFVKKSREIFPKTPWGAMGIKVFDYDNDGLMDIFITDMHSDMSEEVEADREKLKSRMQWTESFLQSGGNSIYGNAVFNNKGDGNWVEVSDRIGTENYWPWGLSVGDLNADGYEDVFITSSMNYPFRYGINSVLLNNGGKEFLDSEYLLGVEPRKEEKIYSPWFELNCSGKDKRHPECEGRSGKVVVRGALGSRSSVIFDLDDDGDLDIVTNEFNSGPMVLISNLSDRKEISYLKVKLIGGASNRSGLGARVVVRAGAKFYTRVQDGKSGYLSQSDYPLYFGLGDAGKVEGIEVLWPSGKTQSVAGPIEVNRLVEVREE